MRAVAAGLAILPLNSIWVLQMEKVNRGPYPTTISLFANVIFILALLAGLNALLRRVRPSWCFSQAELLAVYTMVAIGSAMAGHDLISVLVQMIPHFAWFATPENRWEELFGREMPRWLTVNDHEALVGFYAGSSSLYADGNWRVWLEPVAWWTAFILALGMIMLCVGILVRNMWVERERLTYPVVELPLRMTQPDGALWRNRLFWAGVILAGSIDILNGFNFLIPNLPVIMVKHQDLGPSIVNKPWNAVGWFPIAFYPFAIGLGYLLPVDLLFSCWFFYLFWKGQLVVSNAMGWDALPEFPFVREQNYGGYLAIVVILAYNGRHYIRSVLRRALGMASDVDDAREALSYRACFATIALCSGFLLWFLMRMGMSLALGVAALFMYFVISVVITRIRAELGPPVHDQHFSGPDTLIVQGVGSEHLSRGDLVSLNFFYFFNRAYRGHPMPIMAEGLKAASVVRASQRRFAAATVTAMLVGIPVAFWAFLHLAYQYGMAAKVYMGFNFSAEAFNRVALWIGQPSQASIPKDLAILLGFVTALGLGIVRNSIFSFPLHPIGYAISGSWSMNLVWFPLLIAWAVKSTILRYGGLPRYRMFLPFFLGLILGQSIVGSLWSLIGLALGIPTYSFWGA